MHDQSSLEWQQKYQAYLRSAQWKNIRDALFKMRGKKCELCKQGALHFHVHHLTYERLGRELAKDLQVVCSDCHDKADKKREQLMRQKREERRQENAFGTWCEKKGISDPDPYRWDEFQEWLERKAENHE